MYIVYHRMNPRSKIACELNISGVGPVGLMLGLL